MSCWFRWLVGFVGWLVLLVVWFCWLVGFVGWLVLLIGWFCWLFGVKVGVARALYVWCGVTSVRAYYYM